MTNYSWKSATSNDWNVASDWTPAGPPNAATADATIAVAGAYTVTIATAEKLGSGTFTLGGTVQTISGALALNGAALDIASGDTVTLTGAVTWSGGGDVVGPGTLATSGTTTVDYALLDGGLTWTNSGTVLDSYYIYVDKYLTSSTLTNTVVNQATGIFDFTSDGFNAFYNEWSSAQTNFTNAGLLEKTAGTGTATFIAALTNTGTVLAASGQLNLANGGTLGGLLTTTVMTGRRGRTASPAGSRTTRSPSRRRQSARTR